LAEEETRLTREAKPLFRLLTLSAVSALLALAPRPAHADFFDDARRTFQTDIPHFFTQNVPHFFQDDIPCAFGGHPTSGARKSCNAPPDNAKSNEPEAPPAKPEPVTPPVNNAQ
jgi:hypothetical protein